MTREEQAKLYEDMADENKNNICFISKQMSDLLDDIIYHAECTKANIWSNDTYSIDTFCSRTNSKLFKIMELLVALNRNEEECRSYKRISAILK